MREFFSVFAPLRLCVFALLFFVPVTAQNVAVLSPDRSETSRSFAEKLEGALGKSLRVIDSGMSEAAFLSAKTENTFNLTTDAAKAIGSAIGCDFFLLVNSATSRRSSSQRDEYYESHAAIHAVSSRSGRLIFWRLLRFEEQKPDAAQNLLDDAVNDLASQIVHQLKLTIRTEMTEPPRAAMEEPPDDNSPAAKNFKAPIPYRRIKPDYTADAFLYDVRATVDIIVDLARDGAILRTEIVRWAGYGLDESVEKAVRAMKWRPAMRDGKPLSMRFLLRYNFKEIQKGHSEQMKTRR